MQVRTWKLMFMGCTLLGTLACNELTGKSGSDELPAGVPDPKTLDNPAGALSLYNSAVCLFQQCSSLGGVFTDAILIGGLFGDELQSNRLGVTVPVVQGSTSLEFPVDARQVTGENYQMVGLVYPSLHAVRRIARIATAALRKYETEMNPVLRSHMFALEGYAEILLADLYCSGVPLSTVDPGGDYTYQPGSTTQEVYLHAITLFDSALAISTDSTRILNLARVGKARALLNLGRFADAANVAHTVPDGFTYQYQNDWKIGVTGGFTVTRLTVSNREGTVGLPYRSSRDPRTTVVRYGTNLNTRDTLWFPAKYGTQTSISAITVADATEARLIEAEAALKQPDVVMWLGLLNTLRTNGTFTVRPNATVPTQIDTLWNAGSGGIAGLAPLRDPGATLAEPARTTARVDLMFAERAAWMFLTGHRQGDMRRLVRVESKGGYGRAQELVYPNGPYAGGAQWKEYGSHVSLIIPDAEFLNTKFTGCLEGGA